MLHISCEAGMMLCKQSKGYQGLISKEPVSRSPFQLGAMESLASNSKRLHGPHLSGGGQNGDHVGGAGGKRVRRRKTVTFDEECDVVEFDTESEVEDDDYGEGGWGEGRDVFGFGEGDVEMDIDWEEEATKMDVDVDSALPHPHEQEQAEDAGNPEDSFESVPLSTSEQEDSITGMVNSMLKATAASSRSPDSTITTPPGRPHDEDDDEDELDDDVPLGRRVLAQRSTRSPSPPV